MKPWLRFLCVLGRWLASADDPLTLSDPLEIVFAGMGGGAGILIVTPGGTLAPGKYVCGRLGVLP